MVQQSFSPGLRDWLHLFPMCLEPISILVFFLPESGHGWVVDGIAEMVPGGDGVARVAGGWLRSEPILEVVGEALSLGRVESATGVDAGEPLRPGVVDLSGFQPDLAGDERVVGVAISAVVASRVKDGAEVHSPCDDEV